MSRQKVVYIVSDVEKSLGLEWVADRLPETFDQVYILIGKEKTPFGDHLLQRGIRCFFLPDEQYSSYFSKWIKIYSILKSERPDVVHVHLWRAMLLGLSAAWFLGVKKRIFTRHHATIHYEQYPSGRKWDVLCNAMATHIIAISKNIRDILVERDKAKESKVILLYHGFDFNYFREVSQQRIDALRVKYSIPHSGSPVVGVISRYTEWKGVQYIIPAFKELRKQYPKAHLVLANASGDYADTIKGLLAELPRESFTEIRFEEDLAALYHVFDIFVHVPVNPQAEAFGQIYIESLIAGVPSVVTLSGVAAEFINSGNAFIVDFKDSEAIRNGIITLATNDNIRCDMIEEGKKSIGIFSIEEHIAKLSTLYRTPN